MGVDGVVHDTPESATNVHGEGDDPVHSASDRGPTQKCTPIECQACVHHLSAFRRDASDGHHHEILTEHEVRIVGDPLHKGVDDDQAQG